MCKIQGGSTNIDIIVTIKIFCGIIVTQISNF